MDIVYHKNFIKLYEKLPSKQQDKIEQAIDLFQEDPHHPQLKNHALHGKERGKRAIAAGGDLRLVFEEENDYQKVIFVRVGTHTQVYE